MIPILLKEIRDTLRSRWLLLYALALAVLGTAAALTGVRSAAGLGLQAFGRTAATLTNLCLLLAPLTALAMGSLTIAGERDRGTLDHLLAQPIERRDLLLGKYFGLLIGLGLATTAGFVPAALVLSSSSGPASLLRLLPFPLLAGLLISAMLAVGLLISVRAASGVHALGAAMALWFLFVLLYDLLLVGVLMTGGLGAGGLATLLLLNPVDCTRVLVVLTLETDLYLLGPAGALLIDRLSLGGAATALVGCLLLWTNVSLGLALRSFRLRARRRPARTVQPVTDLPADRWPHGSSQAVRSLATASANSETGGDDP